MVNIYFKVEISGQLYNFLAKLYNLPKEIAFLVIPDDAYNGGHVLLIYIHIHITFVSKDIVILHKANLFCRIMVIYIKHIVI